jgi:hypothetical protein
LLARIEGACDWELNRRIGWDYEWKLAAAAFPPEEHAVSINTAMALRATFGQDSPHAGRGPAPLSGRR